MSDKTYTPDEAELIGCYAASMEEHAGENYATAKSDAERGITKIRAEAWDEGYEAGALDVGGGLREYELTPNPHRIESGASNE